MILVPLSDHPFYLWQALVQAQWMAEHGWRATFLVYCQGEPSARLRRVMAAGVGSWVVWPDWSRDRAYNAAMKPWLVGKWLLAHPEQVGESHLVLDPDALPLRVWPDAEPGSLLGTDTDSYTGPRYLKSKQAWEPLCGLLGVDAGWAEAFPGVGAQYVFTGISGAWWEHVAVRSVEAWRMLSRIPAPAGDPYPVQAWCAEMYVTQLLGIRDGIVPIADPAMGMVWANGSCGDLASAGFFHDAGQQVEDGRHFCKLTHQVSPWGKPLEVDEGSASAFYVELIRRTAAAHPELVW